MRSIPPAILTPLIVLLLSNRPNPVITYGCADTGFSLSSPMCCSDRNDECYVNGPRQFLSDDSLSCFCDNACIDNYDCCADYYVVCQQTTVNILLSTTATSTCVDIWTDWCVNSLPVNECDNDLYKQYCCKTCSNRATTMRPITTSIFTTTFKPVTSFLTSRLNTCSNGDLWGSWCQNIQTKEQCDDTATRDNCCDRCYYLLGITANTVSATKSTITPTMTTTIEICVDIWTDWCVNSLPVNECDNDLYKRYCCKTCLNRATTTWLATTSIFTTTFIATTTFRATICFNGDQGGSWCQNFVTKEHCGLSSVRDYCCVRCNYLLGGNADTHAPATSTASIKTITTAICANIWIDWCPQHATPSACLDQFVRSHCCNSCSKH